MRIAMILPSLAKTGPGFVVKDLCTEFVRMGHECKVFYFDEGEGLVMPCPTECIKFRKPFDFDNWDIIHSHMFRPDAYVWYHRRKIRKSGSKTVSTLHQPISFKILNENDPFHKTILFWTGWQMFLRTIECIVVLNSVTQEELPKKIRKKSHVIFNGRVIKEENCICDEECYVLQRKTLGYTVLGTASSLTKRKGIDQMIQALSFLEEYVLVILGEGPELISLKNLASSLNVQDRCLFMGFKNNVNNYLKLIDIFLMCSSAEGFPLAYIEASAAGKPSVLSDIPILKSITSPQNGACFYKRNDINDLVSKILFVKDNLHELSGKARRYFESSLSSTSMANNYIKIYDRR